MVPEPTEAMVERLHSIRDFLNTVTGWTGSSPDELQEAVEDVDHLLAASGPQLTAEEKDAIPLLLEAAQNYDTRLPAEQGGEAQHSLVAKLSLIAHGEKP